MTLAAAQEEYQQIVIGPVILQAVERAARTLIGRYPPAIYARSQTWDEGFEDLVQDVVLTALLEEGQLDYIMVAASSDAHFSRLLLRQAKRVLSHRRTRTVVDNLLARLKVAANDPPYRRTDRGGRWAYERIGDATETNRNRDDASKEASTVVAALPTVRPRGIERAPVVFQHEALLAILEVLEVTHGSPVDVGDLDRVLKNVLTSWVPSFLEQEESSTQQDRARELTPEEETDVNEAAAVVLGRLTSAQRAVIAKKLTGIADSSIADGLGVSRPTVIKHRNAATDVIRAELVDLPERLQEVVFDKVTVALLTEDASHG